MQLLLYSKEERDARRGANIVPLQVGPTRKGVSFCFIPKDSRTSFVPEACFKSSCLERDLF